MINSLRPFLNAGRKFSLFAAAFLPLPGLLAQPAITFPTAQGVNLPTPLPTSPVEWDIFTPPNGSAAPTSGAPVIAEWSRTAGPDDSVILAGDQFSTLTGNAQGSDTEFFVYGQTDQDNSILSATLLKKIDGGKALLTLPSNLPASSTYLLWPKNAAGTGQAVALNRTEAWWLYPAGGAAPQQVVSIYGRNLTFDDQSGTSWIYLKPYGTAGQWVAPISTNPYCVQFQVPESLHAGTYEVWVHNGHGGNFGWSGPLTLVATPSYAWNGSVFNVRSYGAAGDGISDDTGAVSAANDDMLNYRDRTGLHPTLYFPAGTYLLRRGIGLEHDVRYQGDGKELTILKCHQNFPLSPGNAKLGLLFSSGGSVHDVEVRDLTLDVTTGFRAEGEPGYAFNGAWISAADIRLLNLRIKSGSLDVGCMSTHQTERLQIAGCDFFGGEVFLYRDNGVEITHCTFFNANYQAASIRELTASNFSISHCRFQDVDGTAHASRGQGRLLAGSSNQGAQEHAYIGDNVTVDFGPDPEDNSGEQIICEGNLNTFDWGVPLSATADTIVFREKLKTNYDKTPATAVITAGRGMGQHRRIQGWNGTDTLQVTPYWNVVPDSTSVVLIEASTDRWIIYRNKFEGKSYYATAYTATTAIEPYGACYDWIGDKNTITHMRTALYISAVQDFVSAENRIHPCYFHSYANNVIQQCYQGIYAGCGSTGSTTIDPGVGFFGNIFRNNLVNDITTVGAGLTTFQTTGASAVGVPLDMTLFEHNLFSNLPQGFDCDLAGSVKSRNLVLYKNGFQRGAAGSVNSVGLNLSSAAIGAFFSGNSWSGFSTQYRGPVSNAVFETFPTSQKPKDLQLQIWSY